MYIDTLELENSEETNSRFLLWKTALITNLLQKRFI